MIQHRFGLLGRNSMASVITLGAPAMSLLLGALTARAADVDERAWAYLEVVGGVGLVSMDDADQLVGQLDGDPAYEDFAVDGFRSYERTLGIRVGTEVTRHWSVDLSWFLDGDGVEREQWWFFDPDLPLAPLDLRFRTLEARVSYAAFVPAPEHRFRLGGSAGVFLVDGEVDLTGTEFGEDTLGDVSGTAPQWSGFAGYDFVSAENWSLHLTAGYRARAVDRLELSGGGGVVPDANGNPLEIDRSGPFLQMGIRYSHRGWGDEAR